MKEEYRAIFDMPCSVTFREYEAEVNGTLSENAKPPRNNYRPLNDEDTALLKTFAHLLGIDCTPHHKKTITQKKEWKGVAL